jgi:hypothetical protein
MGRMTPGSIDGKHSAFYAAHSISLPLCRPVLDATSIFRSRQAAPRLRGAGFVQKPCAHYVTRAAGKERAALTAAIDADISLIYSPPAALASPRLPSLSCRRHRRNSPLLDAAHTCSVPIDFRDCTNIMPLCDGASCRSLIASGPFPLAFVAKWL